jgi:hypothetical protein
MHKDQNERSKFAREAERAGPKAIYVSIGMDSKARVLKGSKMSFLRGLDIGMGTVCIARSLGWYHIILEDG